MSAVNDTCNLGPTFWKILDNSQYVCYDILPFIYFPIGVFSHLISLLAFYRRLKAEKEFGYQALCAFAELGHVIALTVFIYINFQWSGIQRGVQALWFRNSYFLMFWAAHLNTPVMHTAVTNALLLSLAMTIERVMAMAIPFKYKNFNHKRQQILVFIGCTIISAGSSVFDTFRVKFVNADAPYVIDRDAEFINSTFAFVSSHFRNALRVIGLVALITCNALMVWYFHKRGQKVKQLAWVTVEKDRARKAQERNLIILTVAQSIQTAIKILAEVSLLFFSYSIPWFNSCGYLKLMAPTVDSIIQTADIVGFFIVLIVNKQYRAMMLRLFRKGNQVQQNQ